MLTVNSWLFNGDGHMFYGNGWWMILPIIFIVLATLIFGFWRRGSGTCIGRVGMDGHSDETSHPAVGALEVLRRRYALGELTDEQFDAMRRRLEE